MPLLSRSSGSDSSLLELLVNFGEIIESSSALLLELISDYPEQRNLAKDLVELEHKGDKMAHTIIQQLNTSSSLSVFSIEDGYRLTTALDDVVDDTEAVADMLSVYRVEAPTDQASQLAGILLESSKALVGALKAFQAGEEVKPHLVEIHRLENEGDRVSRDAIASLFETGLDPLFVIRWKDIYGALEDAIDCCETVAHHLEGIVLKRRK